MLRICLHLGFVLKLMRWWKYNNDNKMFAYSHRHQMKFSNSFVEGIFKCIKFVYAFSTFLIKIIIITIVFNTRDKVRQRVQCTHDLMRTQSHVNPQNETITILWKQQHNDNSTAGWQCLLHYSIHSFEMKKSSGQFNLFAYQMHCCHFHTMAVAF